MRRSIFIFVILFPFMTAAEESCFCNTDHWPLQPLEPVFAEDPFVSPGEGFISSIHEHDVAVSSDGDCVIFNSFPDAPVAAPWYVDEESGWKLLKQLWLANDGTERFLTLEETAELAKTICWGPVATS